MNMRLLPAPATDHTLTHTGRGQYRSEDGAYIVEASSTETWFVYRAEDGAPAGTPVATASTLHGCRAWLEAVARQKADA